MKYLILIVLEVKTPPSQIMLWFNEKTRRRKDKIQNWQYLRRWIYQPRSLKKRRYNLKWLQDVQSRGGLFLSVRRCCKKHRKGDNLYKIPRLKSPILLFYNLCGVRCWKNEVDYNIFGAMGLEVDIIWKVLSWYWSSSFSVRCNLRL